MLRTFVLSFTTVLLTFPAFAVDQKTQAVKNKFYRPRLTRTPGQTKPKDSGGAVALNAASFEPGVSPGGLVTIFGSDLTSVNGVVIANTNPLPLRLANVQVTIAGIPAPIYSIAYTNGQDQISVQTPYDTPTGPGAAEIQVYDGNVLTADFLADSFTEDPGIFTYKGNFAIAEAADYSLIGPDNPAIPGQPLTLYVTGLGPLTLDMNDGYGSPTQPPFAQTIDPFDVIVDGEKCSVFFSGLAPGFVGLYQVNFYVPRDAANGDLSIFIQSPYATSATGTLPVR